MAKYHLVFILILLVVSNLSLVPPNRFSVNSKLAKSIDHTTESNFGLNKLSFRTETRCYGIPKLFRWLVDLYPIVLESVGEGLSDESADTDNFYLDMNGIIHTCTHANNDGLIPLKEQEMFLKIFAYTDRLYKLVKPRKLMFLAVDGVAPRAKMNQQRSRRFRSSKDREMLIADYVAKEGVLPDIESFDSNCITPGTEFMYRLGIAFRRWIEYKMKTDEFWKSNSAEIVFSGPDVPGEGEHKVMDMIRDIQKNDKTYEKGKLRHCMYGLDADLIMLSLVTHEPYFTLLREKISQRKKNKVPSSFSPNDFELLEISVLRQMLKQHFRLLEKEIHKNLEENEKPTRKSNKNSGNPGNPNWTMGFDLERIIDDFVFMCFFVGNDFLPCVPHLDIADGSLNLMMNVYRDLLPQLGGYLTNKNALHLPRIELFVQEIARREPLYFQQRAVDEKDPKYGGDNYRDHYYQTKFGIKPGDEESIQKIVRSYLEGLTWVLTYYHEGCGSWIWYYPYLYGPLATDLINLSSYKLEFEQGLPFTPLLQLLSVLPPQSSNFLPPSYANIMKSPNSPLAEYYPADFVVDANGKKNAWESVVCIPFIREDILINEVNKIDHFNELTESERLRNLLGEEYRFKPNEDTMKSVKKTVGEVKKEKFGNALKNDFKKSNDFNKIGNFKKARVNTPNDIKKKIWKRTTQKDN